MINYYMARQSILISVQLIVLFIVFASCKKSPPLVPPPQVSAPPPVNYTIEVNPSVLYKVRQKINESIGGFYASVPFNYQQAKHPYPALIFFHGDGQKGDGNVDLDKLAIDGMGKMLFEKKFPISFNHSGNPFSFLVFCPQFSRNPNPEQVMGFIDHLVKTYRIDTNRIYLSGLSSGGIVITEAAAKYPQRIAAMVPMGGVVTSNLPANGAMLAKGKVATWVFHNENDPLIKVSTARNFINAINNAAPQIPAILTVFPVTGHDAWTEAISPTYKEKEKNIYEWMLGFSR